MKKKFEIGDRVVATSKKSGKFYLCHGIIFMPHGPNIRDKSMWYIVDFPEEPQIWFESYELTLEDEYNYNKDFQDKMNDRVNYHRLKPRVSRILMRTN